MCAASSAVEGEVSADETAFLDRAVAHTFLFTHLSAPERKAVYAVMQRVPVQVWRPRV